MRKNLPEIQDNKMTEKDIEQEEVYSDTKNRFMTYFLLIFPIIILIAIPDTINGSTLSSISIKFLIAFYYFVTLKTFVDKHYEYN